MSEKEHSHVAFRFAKNWVMLWWSFLHHAARPATYILAFLLGSVVGGLYLSIPMIAYAVNKYGWEEAVWSESITISGSDGLIIVILMVVWIALNVSVVSAAYRTYNDD